MNVCLPHSWLLDFLETRAKPEKIAAALSLSSASVEKIEKVRDDYLYHLEVTTNRVDMASVLGIAREAAAALPRFGISAKLKWPPPKKPPHELVGGTGRPPTTVKITKPFLCPRFTAVLLEEVKIKPSPLWLRERLEKGGTRALNNVIDISNYLMLELGQPAHTFDYDKILGGTMILRESERGEEIITLDGITRRLPQGAIVIEDGKGRLIDLCGIMGGENSAIEAKTKRVLLFIQTYDPLRIRRTCQTLSFRTPAATLFEKSLDPENVWPAIVRGIELLEKIAGAKAVPKILDIYPHPYQPKTLKLDLILVEKILGVKIPPEKIQQILESLGFHSQFAIPNSQFTITIPSWRANDIQIPQDLIEEISRIWGYHHLPSALPTGAIPQVAQDPTFFWEEKVKMTLKNWGFTELYTYSLVSQKILKSGGFNPLKALRVTNPLTEEWEYLRPSLIPAILKVVAENQANFEKMKLFELSHVYLPKRSGLPEEKLRLTGLIIGEAFYEAKGIVESLLGDLGIKDSQFLPLSHKQSQSFWLWHPTRSAMIKNKKWGVMGEIHPEILKKFGIKNRLVVFDLDFGQILKLATTQKTYTPLPKYPPLIEDLAFLAPPQVLTTDLQKAIKASSHLIWEVFLFDQFRNTRTFRIIYQDPRRNLSAKEATKIRRKIIKILEEKFHAKLKGI